MDAQLNWAKVVELAKESDVIFNNIDIGAYYDYACLALAKSLHIPYGAGSSYARTWIVEFFTGKYGESSFSYMNRDGNQEIFDKLHPSLIQDYDSLDFIERDPTPPTRSIGSNVLVCSTAGLMTVNAWVQYLCGFPTPNYTLVDVASYWRNDIVAWEAPEDPEEKVEEQE
eukprot:TRINITY_DN956_c0_g1_i2.p1 TRINITY_DN956_c0_g1~~TRINITY_DN956_c0_g1_i2.p1  ORF type:complete len:170 (-),score=53.05 TRINITY_DN956_c0_g1_i2:53-562(-)